MYGHGRNSAESFNAHLKDGGTHALEDGSRRGSAAQYFLATLTVVAANLDKILDFAGQKVEDGHDREAGIEAPRASSVSLVAVLPSSASPTSAVEHDETPFVHSQRLSGASQIIGSKVGASMPIAGVSVSTFGSFPRPEHVRCA